MESKLTLVTDYLTWFDHELAELQNSPRVNLKIHVTSQKISKEDISSPSPVPSPDEEAEKGLVRSPRPAASRTSSLRNAVELGRPDIDAIVKQTVDNAPRDSRVLVAASGPSSLLTNSRLAVKERMSSQSASVDLHLEEFDW
jgi:hypothetical protein